MNLRGEHFFAALFLFPTLVGAEPWHGRVVEVVRQPGAESHWRLGLERLPDFCTEAEAKARIGQPACESLHVWVQNDSSLTIQCWIGLDRPDKNIHGRLSDYGVLVIGPAQAGVVMTSQGKSVASPRLDPRCRTIADELPPAPAAPSGCRVKVEARKYLDDYYPRESIRREETGVVAVDTVYGKSGRALDSFVVASSGFTDLDNAGFKLARSLRAVTDCERVTVRRFVHFEKDPIPPYVPKFEHGGGGGNRPLGEARVWVLEN